MYAFKGHLLQSFPHGLPASSLEPGTSDLRLPSTNLFPEAPLGDGEVLTQGTPRQSIAQLRHAATNIQQLVAELSASLWDKATNQEELIPTRQQASTMEGITPMVPVAERCNTHYAPVYIDIRQKMLDVEGYVPKEANLGYPRHKSDAKQERRRSQANQLQQFGTRCKKMLRPAAQWKCHLASHTAK